MISAFIDVLTEGRKGMKDTLENVPEVTESKESSLVIVREVGVPLDTVSVLCVVGDDVMLSLEKVGVEVS